MDLMMMSAAAVPAHVPEHHLRRKDLGARVDVVLACVLRRSGRGWPSNIATESLMLAPGAMPDAAHLGPPRASGDVVAGSRLVVARTRVFGRGAAGICCSIASVITSFTVMSRPRPSVLELVPRAAVDRAGRRTPSPPACSPSRGKPPSVNFWMLPLWTRVDGKNRACCRWRTGKPCESGAPEPSIDTGLMPMAELVREGGSSSPSFP